MGFEFSDSQKRILLCGATDYDDPFSWQEELNNDEEFSDFTFTNPYELGDDVDDPYENPSRIMEPIIDEISRIDGVLVSWQDNAFLIGAVVYMYEAYKKGIPIVVWYQGNRDTMQIPLSWMMDSFHEDRETAIRVLLAKLGDTNVLTG